MINWPSKFYDVMKYVLTIAVPAFIAFYLGIANLYGLDNGEIVTGTVALVATFLGALLNISSANYRKGGGNDNGQI